ncbi:uncharacterized protein K02A2.6-like [Oreochromis niloticus]|uniref:Gypsy retrotransposon integrase-like protein 1 n=1 Tax=Oreochromis niloticus TaxID=8128 RepID=A0A669CFI6_ORENI|nr:uncharacterized protein K02A2.6-like [Oreochromis niloticus]
MAGMIGQMDPFDDAGEQWATYIERFEHYILANDIQPEKRVPVLLSVMGPKTYGLLRNLVAPSKPGTMQYDNIVGVLQAHFAPKPLVIAERFRFHKRNQGEEETVAQYVAVLKRLSEHYEFGAYLEDALRDRFVCGLKCETVQKRLLTEKDLTFRKAVDYAVSAETATREVQQLSGSLKVNAVLSQKGDKCRRCGKMNHTDDDCWYKDRDCHQCGRKGHTKRMCKGRTRSSQDWNRKAKEGKPELKGYAVKNRAKDKKRRIHHVAAEESGSEGTRPDTDSELELYSLSRKEKYSRISLMPVVNGKKMEMELDTGAAVSLIPWEQYKSMLSQLPLQPTDIMLKTYTGEPLAPEGVIKVQVELNKQRATLPLYVVKVDAPPLFGREWLRVIKLNWKDLKMIHAREQSGNDNLEAVLKKHSAVFSKELGTMKGIKARLTLRPDSVPKFCPPRNVPYALRPRVEAELKRLTELGVITPVEHSDWATPVVPVNKKDGSVRLCGDFKVTLNSQLCVDKYPLPRIEDLFASLAGGQHFSKLHLANAYLQMEVEEESKKLLTVSTQKGLFRFNRLPFGVASSPALFQKAMDQVLLGLPYTHCYLDDILVSGPDKQTHLRTLKAVLGRLEDYGLHLKQEKCLFFQESVEYLGHIIDAAGLHKSPEKVRAVMEAPAPADVSQLRSFLGMLNYYGRFIPDLATVLKPLNELLSKEKKWQWTSACESAFQKAKEHLASPEILTHYNPELPLRLACDASPYGVGAVLSHVMPDGQERPIAYASRTLSKAERNYAQIEREALAIVFGVRKFHQYLHGNKFTLLTDHHPLTSILSPVKGTPSMAAARMQRWALLLSAHNYTLQYRKGAHHANADGLSRLPLPLAQKEKQGAVEVFYASQLDTLPVGVAEIRRDTLSDVTLSRVLEMVTTGRFPAAKDADQELSPYLMRRHELTIQQGCLMWGVRVVVPPKLRSHVLKELHAAHPGMVRMKSLARSYVWWPGIDSQIELQAKACHSCQRVQKEPGLAPLHPWLWPSCPWERIHVDFAGPFEGHMYLVVVDAHSKWPEVHIMDSTTAGKTIQVLRGLFSRHGIPHVLVSDNGPQFCSEEFRVFLKANGVKHIRSAPYHPATNGLAERFVQTFKHALKASRGTAPVQQCLDTFLLTYRNTPHATTRETPAILFIGHKLRSRLDFLKPSVAGAVRRAQDAQQQCRQQHSRDRQFTLGEPVLVRDYRKGEDKWTHGVVLEKTGPVSYKVNVGAQGVWKRHVDQMLTRPESVSQQVTVDPPTSSQMSPAQSGSDTMLHPCTSLQEETVEQVLGTTSPPETLQSLKPSPTDCTQVTESVRRYPVRVTKPPVRYRDG